jgi:agmatinase
VKGYGPADTSQSPRFAGISTFLRLPNTTDLSGADVAAVGLPFDTGASFRVGARFGPKGLREASCSFRADYDPELDVRPFEHLSAIDYGDAPVVPGATVPSLERMTGALEAIHRAGVVPLALGGDHTVLLAELRAAAAVHGPVAVVQFDSHCDTRDVYYGERYTHGTVLRRAVEEGLVDATRSTLMGMRGGLAGPGDHDEARELGFTVIRWTDLAERGSAAVEDAVARAGGRKTALTFDIDFVDPAYAPGTGTPVCGGPTSMQALELLRACRGLDIVAGDVVEVAPDLDSAFLTTMMGATVAWTILGLIALRRQAAV